MAAITVIIADRDTATRASYLRLIQPEKGIQVVGEAENGLEAIAGTARHKPSILLLEFNLSSAGKLSLLPTLAQLSPRTKVLLLTNGISKRRILDALSCGALGYLEKRVLKTFLSKAIRRVDAGEAWVPRKMTSEIFDRLAHLT